MALDFPTLVESNQLTALIPNVLYFASLSERPPPLSRDTLCHPAWDREKTDALCTIFNISEPFKAVSPLHSCAINNNNNNNNNNNSSVHSGQKIAKSKLCECAHPANISASPAPSSSSVSNQMHGGGLLTPDALFYSYYGDVRFVYRPFFADFGPLDVGCCVAMARRLAALLEENAGYVWRRPDPSAGRPCWRLVPGDEKGGTAKKTNNKERKTTPTLPLVFCSGLDGQERLNAATLLSAFCVLALGWTTEETETAFGARLYPPLLAYRDASQGASNYPLQMGDILGGLERAVELGWIDPRTFDLDAHQEGKRVDYHWIVPHTFLAMSSPEDAKPHRSATHMARVLGDKLGVGMVVRLNESLYDPSPLRWQSIQHVDLPYPDGSTPSDATLATFMKAVEDHLGWPSSLGQYAAGATRRTQREGKKGMKNRSERPSSCPSPSVAQSLSGKAKGETVDAVPHKPRRWKGAIAVHCYAGLGRTGTLIAICLMAHYGFTARRAIGWMRLCRPGSITGVQQQYLDTMERRLRPSSTRGAGLPRRSGGGGRRLPSPVYLVHGSVGEDAHRDAGLLASPLPPFAARPMSAMAASGVSGALGGSFLAGPSATPPLRRASISFGGALRATAAASDSPFTHPSRRGVLSSRGRPESSGSPLGNRSFSMVAKQSPPELSYTNAAMEGTSVDPFSNPDITMVSSRPPTARAASTVSRYYSTSYPAPAEPYKYVSSYLMALERRHGPHPLRPTPPPPKAAWGATSASTYAPLSLLPESGRPSSAAPGRGGAPGRSRPQTAVAEVGSPSGSLRRQTRPRTTPTAVRPSPPRPLGKSFVLPGSRVDDSVEEPLQQSTSLSTHTEEVSSRSGSGQPFVLSDVGESTWVMQVQGTKAVATPLTATSGPSWACPVLRV